ncbi:MAG: TetR/AcrR family transcriptional regulator [Jatrophihabitantaceae bacterium]
MSTHSSPRRPDPLTDFVLRPTTASPVPGAQPRVGVTGSAALGGPAAPSGSAPRPGSSAAPSGSSAHRPQAARAGSRPVSSPAATANSRTAGPMARSRAAILDGARAAVEANGTKITMAQVAARGGVAKATLYNHFRAREDVLAALLLDEIDRLVAAVAHLELSQALTTAAVQVSEHPLLEALGGQDTTTLAVLARVDVRTPGWARVAQAVEQLLRRSGLTGTPTVLRWLSSFIIAPAEEIDIAADVAVLLSGLPPTR